MKKSRCIRILVRLFVYSLIGLSCILFTSIWWLPLALPSLLRIADVEVESVERQETGRLQLVGVVYSTDTMHLQASSAQIPSLHQYLWERFGASFSEASLVEVDSLVLELLPTEGAEVSAEPVDAVLIERQLRTILAEYGPWLPPLELGEIVVNQPEEAPLLTVREISLRDWQLAASVQTAQLPEVLHVQASLAPQATWAVQLAAEEAGLSASVVLKHTDSGFDLIYELNQSVDAAAGVISFIEGQQLPVRADFASERITLDSEWLPVLEALRWEAGALSGVNLLWENGRYTGALGLSAGVVAGERSSMPVAGVFKFSGDFETLRVDALQLDANWGQLSLDQPLEVSLKDGSVSQRAELTAKLDLAKQSFVAASGRVDAQLSVVPSLVAGPNLSVELSARDLAYDTFRADRVDFVGSFKGSMVSIERMHIQPQEANEAAIKLSGSVDLSAKDLDLSYHARLTPDWVNAFVDQVTLSDELKTSGRIAGSFQRPQIKGALEAITVEYPGLTPVTVSGDYQSNGLNAWRVAATLAAAGAVIDTSLTTVVQDGRVAVDLNRLIWTDPVRPTLNLVSPTHFSYQFSGPADFPESRLVLGAFHFAGPELEVQGEWHPEAGLELLLSHVTLQRIGRWVNRELPSLSIESVALSLSELRPLLVGSLEVHLESRAVIEDAPLRVDLLAQLTPTGLTAKTVQLKFAGAPLLEGSITAPIVLQIPQEGRRSWQLLEDGDLAAELSGLASPAFSNWLLSTTGVKLSEALLELNVTGTIQRPVGSLEMKVASLSTSVADGATFDRLEIVAKAESDTVQLERFNFLINQSEVSGVLSLPTEGLVDAVMGDMDQRKAWAAHASGRIDLVDWQAEDWIDFLPEIMRRSGRLSGLLELKPDWDLSGNLSFQDFAVRPTDSLPSVDLIGGQVELSNRMLSVKKASAQVGGSPVNFEGWLDASDLKSPLWEFAVSGLNVPLVRTTDMILRSDLDVQASHTSRSETPLVRGALNLRSSTMLVEFDPLAPSVESGPRSRPPFFSITEPTLADWRFDMKVAGDSFMRVRSPYFRTQLTANFDLGGTFAEPLLIGSIWTVDGELRFPGAKMRIANGEAYIEQGSPNSLQLNFNGMAQKASHIITMEVTQTLDDPHIQFQSTPALSNASIVRLLTTGSTSGGGVGTVGLYLGQGLLGSGGMDEQLSDRLTLDVGEETSRSGRNTVGVRYDLSEDVFLEGGYDVYDAYNLDLIWSLFKR